MFLNNKYTKWYYSIINRALSRTVLPIIYTEKHHIIPKCLDGSNDIQNIVVLTAREHFICHLLLTKMVEGAARRSMWYASYMMCKGTLRYKPTARIYETLRQNMISANKDRPGPNKGKTFSKEHRDKLSLSRKGKSTGPKSEEHKQNLRKPKPEGFGKKVSEYRTGKSWGHKHTDETKEKMSSWQKGVPKLKIRCEFCNEYYSLVNYSTWHGDNCKLNPNYKLREMLQMNSIKTPCEHCGKEFNTGNYSRWHGDNCKSK
jgi:hypothetical protein